jgi:hypothetical protein
VPSDSAVNGMTWGTIAGALIGGAFAPQNPTTQGNYALAGGAIGGLIGNSTTRRKKRPPSAAPVVGPAPAPQALQLPFGWGVYDPGSGVMTVSGATSPVTQGNTPLSPVGSSQWLYVALAVAGVGVLLILVMGRK